METFSKNHTWYHVATLRYYENTGKFSTACMRGYYIRNYIIKRLESKITGMVIKRHGK
jgi:hypothetical protein